MEVEDTWSSAMLSALCLTISRRERTKIYLFQIKQRRTHCCIYCTLHSLHTHLRHRFHKHASSWQSAGIQRFWWEVYYVSLPSPGPRGQVSVLFLALGRCKVTLSHLWALPPAKCYTWQWNCLPSAQYQGRGDGWDPQAIEAAQCRGEEPSYSA